MRETQSTNSFYLFDLNTITILWFISHLIMQCFIIILQVLMKLF